MTRTPSLLCTLVTCIALSACLSDDSSLETTRGYVDLGLPSRTLWAASNEPGYFTYAEAFRLYGDQLPTAEMVEELISQCTWQWMGSGFDIIGPNHSSITLLATGWSDNSGETFGQGDTGMYWTRTSVTDTTAVQLYFTTPDIIDASTARTSLRKTIRLVSHPAEE